jgi:hypothetical protein
VLCHPRDEVLAAAPERRVVLAERVRQEADERWAEQSVVEDGQSLSVQVARLRATAALAPPLTQDRPPRIRCLGVASSS